MQAFGLDACLVGGFASEEGKGQLAKDDELCLSIATSNATIVFVESHVQAPVAAILDLPVGSLIYAKVMVDNDVARAHHLSPWQIGIDRAPFHRNAAGGLTDYLQGAKRRILLFFIS